MAIYHITRSIIDHYSNLGIRGVAAVAANRLCGWPRTITMKPKCAAHPLTLRLGTSDLAVYKNVLLGKDYAIDAGNPEVIFDIGANIGMASIYYANRYPWARIFAVEPEPSNYDMLVRNVAGYENIIPLQAALWSVDGEIDVDSSFDKWACRVGQRGVSGTPVRALTLPSLMKLFNVGYVDLLKIDIEGAEVEVFDSCDWLDEVGTILVEPHDFFRPGCRFAIEKAVHGCEVAEHKEMLKITHRKNDQEVV